MMDLQDIIQNIGEWIEGQYEENENCDFEIIDNIDSITIKLIGGMEE